MSRANKALNIRAVVRVLELIQLEASSGTDASDPDHVSPGAPQRAKNLYKVGAAIASAQAGSLRGPEVFFMDLAGLREHISKGKNGVIPENPLRAGS